MSDILDKEKKEMKIPKNGSGLLSLTGKKDQDPVIPGTQIADIAGGGLS